MSVFKLMTRPKGRPSARRDYTGTFYAMPGFWEGVGRVLDLGGTFDGPNVAVSDEDADWLALSSDWYAVGADLHRSTKRFEAERRADAPR